MSFLTLILLGNICCLAGAEQPQTDAGTWHIADIFEYCKVNMGDLSGQEKNRYARVLMQCQDPETRNFVDSYGDAYYSVKVYHLLKGLGHAPKYPLGVCQQTGTDYCEVGGVPVTENMTPEDFQRWLDKIYNNYDAYSAGSLFGHFITPHLMNLEKSGKTVDDSPFVAVFHKWLLKHQGENGFWNRPGDPDYNGWNGVMKMDSALGMAGIKLPHPERMIRTVLKYQRQDGLFYVGGGCSNHNALHTLRQWSKRYDMLLWDDIFLAMERFAENLEQRYDPVGGYFYPPQAPDQEPQFEATKLASVEIGNVITYCRLLLDPDNSNLFETRKAPSRAQPVTRERVRRILVRAAGIRALAAEKVKAHIQAEHEEKHSRE